MAKNLLVFGGSGYLGAAACKFAVSQGVKVISISRSGAPALNEPWQAEVDYLKGDALDPTTYSLLIPSALGIIHSIGTLLDSRTPFNTSNTYNNSYEHLNRDTALKVCETIENSGVPFVYISSERGLFFAPRYLTTKREVEEFLASRKESIRSSVLRPGYLYSDGDIAGKMISTFIDVANYPDKKFRGNVSRWVSDNFFPARSLNVDVVGKVAVLCAMKEELRGCTLEVDDIEKIARNYHK